MIALDTNLLVYAYREDSEFHSVAMEQIRPVIEGDSPWALPWRARTLDGRPRLQLLPPPAYAQSGRRLTAACA